MHSNWRQYIWLLEKGFVLILYIYCTEPAHSFVIQYTDLDLAHKTIQRPLSIQVVRYLEDTPCQSRQTVHTGATCSVEKYLSR